MISISSFWPGSEVLFDRFETFFVIQYVQFLYALLGVVE